MSNAHPDPLAAGSLPPGPAPVTPLEIRKGTLHGLLAEVLWGIIPIYFVLLSRSSPWEILGQRILWTLGLCAVALTVLRQWDLRARLRGRWLMVVAASGFVTLNWALYIVATTTGRISQTSLGYFLNPLVTVLLGVVFLRERMRPLQWAAVGVSILACGWLLVADGGVPWLAFGLAISFSVYSLLKNRVGPHLGAWQSLTVETAVAAPAAAGLLAWLGLAGRTTFLGNGPGYAALLAASGIATAAPLLLFAAAARRVPLVTIGLLQFITPTMQLLIAVLVFGEHLAPSRWAGFGLVWVGLGLLTLDMVRQLRRRRAGA